MTFATAAEELAAGCAGRPRLPKTMSDEHEGEINHRSGRST